MYKKNTKSLWNQGMYEKQSQSIGNKGMYQKNSRSLWNQGMHEKQSQSIGNKGMYQIRNNWRKRDMKQKNISDIWDSLFWIENVKVQNKQFGFFCAVSRTHGTNQFGSIGTDSPYHPAVILTFQSDQVTYEFAWK